MVFGPPDVAAVLARFGDDAALLSDLARIFVDEMPRRMDALRTGMHAGDAAAVSAAAHGLKGVLYALGCADVGERADDIEGHARAGDLDAATTLVSALSREVDALVTTVATWPTLLAAGPPADRNGGRSVH